MAALTIVILHFGKLAHTSACISRLQSQINGNRLIVVNNTSQDISELQTLIPKISVIENHRNFGFAKGVNQGIALALKDDNCSGVLLLNNDLVISSGHLNDFFVILRKYPQAGIITPLLHHARGYDWGGKLSRWTGLVRHTNWANPPKTVLKVAHVAGAAMYLRRDLIEKIGPFDERFFLYYEDADFCLRTLAAGYTIHITPTVIADHAVSAGSGAFRRTLYQWSSHLKFVTKHLFRAVYPTAYFFNLLFYPLVLLKIVVFGKK